MQVTLIDFTLSRLVTVTGEVAFCDLAADPELFKGPKGSVQVWLCQGSFCACCGAYLSIAWHPAQFRELQLCHLARSTACFTPL